MSYQIIIKDLENDEEILNKKCEAIVGGIAMGNVEEKKYGISQIGTICGNGIAVAEALEAAENAVSSARESLINDMIKNDPDSPLAHLKAFFDSIKKQDEGENEDAGGDR